MRGPRRKASELGEEGAAPQARLDDPTDWRRSERPHTHGLFCERPLAAVDTRGENAALNRRTLANPAANAIEDIGIMVSSTSRFAR